MKGQRVRSRSYHRHADAHIGFAAEAEGTEDEYLAGRLAENLKSTVRERVGNNAYLNTDWRIIEQFCEMFDLSASQCLAMNQYVLRQSATTD